MWPGRGWGRWCQSQAQRRDPRGSEWGSAWAAGQAGHTEEVPSSALYLPAPWATRHCLNHLIKQEFNYRCNTWHVHVKLKGTYSAFIWFDLCNTAVCACKRSAKLQSTKGVHLCNRKHLKCCVCSPVIISETSSCGYIIMLHICTFFTHWF